MTRASRLPLLLIVILLVLLVAVAVADDKEKKDKPKDVKKMNGKELYRNFCKSCHEPESPHGEYTPMTLIQEQWDRFFDEKYVETHKDLADSLHGDKPVTEVIDKDMLKKIRKFCIEGAADSEHPMTCG
jgi:hypothetical protein